MGEEMYAPEIGDFVYITDNAYSAADIRQMELKLLNTLTFNFSRPLPLHFLRRNSKAGDVDVLQHERVVAAGLQVIPGHPPGRGQQVAGGSHKIYVEEVHESWRIS